MLNRQLQNMSHGIEHLQLAEVSEVPYLIAYKPQTDEFYVAFRGIENLQSFLPSLLCVSIPNDFQGRVHAGYAQQAKLIPLSPFTELLKSNPACKLIFTGHSLGGAIAAMVTSNILFDEQSIGHHQRISCIAFGAPFFADERCAVYLNDRFQDRFHFYINQSDPIPFAFCFLHDCLHRLSSLEEMRTCINWIEKLLNLQEATLLSENRSLVNSLVYNASRTQLPEAIEAFKNATCVLRPIFSILKIALSKYQLFGECYHIVTEKLSAPVSNSNPTAANSLTNKPASSQIIVKPIDIPTMHVKWLHMNAESIVNDLISFYQDHGIRNYISELHTHVIVKYRLGLDIKSPVAQLMSNLPPLLQGLPYAHFLPTNNPNQWSNDASESDKYYWSAITTDYPKNKQSSISFQFRGPTVCFFLRLQYCERIGTIDPSQLCWKDAIRQPMCDENNLSFEIKKVETNVKRNLLYRCVHHFGTMDLSKIIDSNKFTSPTDLTGRQQQVADFKLVELYLAALSWLLFIRPSTEEIISVQTTTLNSISYKRHREIKSALLLCEEILLPNRDNLQKNLIDSTKPEAVIFKAEVEKIRAHGARFAESNPSGGNVSNLNINAETSNFELCSLAFQLNTLSSNENSLNIITRAIPTLVAIGMAITDNLLIEKIGHSSLIAAGTGVTAGAATMFLTRLLGGPLMLVVVLGMLFAAGIGYGIYRSLLTVIDGEYFKMLELIAESMGVAMQETRQHPYWLERAISEIYDNKMASYSDKHICDNWKTTYFQHHDLAKISDKQMRLNWLKRVKCVHAHFTLRKQMSEMVTVGVIGIGRVGKSMLIHKMFGFPTRSGVDRTTEVKPYPVSNNFQMLDLPHLTSAYDQMKRSFAHSYTMMHGIIVILDAQQQGDDDRGEGHVLRTVQQLAMEGVDVLFCFNYSDRLIRDYEKGDQSTSAILSDDESDDDSDLSSAKQRTEQCRKKSAEWSREMTVAKIREFADRYEKYGVHPNQCKMTYFDLDEKDKEERERIKEHLKPLDILSGANIRDIWLLNFLKDNGFKETADQIIKFRYKPIIDNK
jgi:GTP-binding protein EngB required for normal cell division